MQSTVMMMRIMSNLVHLRICSNCLRRGRQRGMTDGQGCFEAVYEGQRGVLRNRLKYKLKKIGRTKNKTYLIIIQIIIPYNLLKQCDLVVIRKKNWIAKHECVCWSLSNHHHHHPHRHYDDVMFMKNS